MLAALRARAIPVSYTFAAAAGIGLFTNYNEVKFTRFTAQADASVPDAVPAAIQTPPPAAPPSSEPAAIPVEPAAPPPPTPAAVQAPSEPIEAVTLPSAVAADTAVPPPPVAVDAALPQPTVASDTAASLPQLTVDAEPVAPLSPAVAEVPVPAAVAAPVAVTVETPAVTPAPSAPAVVEAPVPKVPRLTPKEWTPLTLLEKNQVNHNTWFFRFEALPNEDGSPLFPTASCLMIRGLVPDPKGDAKPVVRPYTPVNRESENESVDLVIKVYPTGKMGNLMAGMNPGETIDFKGPLVKFPYNANMKENIGMLAAGTGITPMLQVAQRIVEDPEDKTKVSLIFANISESDILCREQLDTLQAKSNGQFKVYYTVEQLKHGGAFWKGGQGRINRNMVDKLLPGPGDDNLVMVCGPPGFMEAMSGNKTPDRKQGDLKGYLKDLGYSPEQVFKF